MNLQERLKAERERLGFNQTDFAAVAGASKHAQINWEKGASTPNAAALAAWAEHGLDVLFVVTGHRTNSDGATSHRSVGAPPAVIDIERLSRVVKMLEASAKQAGRRWPAERLVAVAAEVYNVLVDEPALDEAKLERILKLVVNR